MIAKRIVARLEENLGWARVHAGGQASAERAPGPWPELLRLWGRPDGEFARGIFSVVLGRKADAEGQAWAAERLKEGVSRQDLVRALMASPEAARARTDRTWLASLDLLGSQFIPPQIRGLWPLPDQGFVRGVYRILLGKEPDEAAVGRGLRYLDGGADRADLVKVVASSPEVAPLTSLCPGLKLIHRMTTQGLWTDLLHLWPLDDVAYVEGLYRVLLQREPDPEGVTWGCDRLEDGYHRVDVLQCLAGGDEFREGGLPADWQPWLPRLSPDGIWAELLGLWPLPAREFVDALYRLLLHRQADPDGLAHHLGHLADGCSRVDVVRQLASSPEFRAFGIDDSWVARLDQLTGEGLWRAIQAAWKLPDEEFVGSLYRLLLHREPEAHGLATQVSALASGVSRTMIVRHLALSDECRRLRLDLSWLVRLPRPTRVAWKDHELIQLPTDEEFVRAAYATHTGRAVTLAEFSRQVWLLRWVPGYSRRVILARLRRLPEARVYDEQRQADAVRKSAELAWEAVRLAFPGHAGVANLLAQGPPGPWDARLTDGPAAGGEPCAS